MGILAKLFGGRGGAMRKALLVDPDPALGELIQSYLEIDRLALDQVYRAAQAQKRLGDYADAPALCIVDVHLPDGNGVELMQSLNRNRQIAQMPILFLADRLADGEEQAIQRAFPLSRVLTKPVQRKEFRAAVGEMLTRSNRKLPVAKASIRGSTPPPSRLKVREE